MLLSSFSFNFFASFLIFNLDLPFSVSITIAKKCLTDDDCDLELMCNTKSKSCTCPEPYFWRDDIRACFGCAPGWLELETRKCLLFAIHHHPGVTWYEAQTSCEGLRAHSMMISNTDEFEALQRKIEYLLNGKDALTATLYFHQGAWIQIDNEWTESYVWCNNDKKQDSFDCVQIQQDSITNTICFQYVACIGQSQFICEAPPLIQSELETNLIDFKRSMVNSRDDEIMLRAPTKKPTTKATIKTTVKVTTRATAQGTTKKTTPKNPSLSINGAANAITNGINAVGQITNAIGNLQGGNTNQQNNLFNNNNQEGPFALSSADDDSGTNWKNILLIGGIIVGVIIVIIVFIVIISVVCLKKPKQTVSRNGSIESYTSVVTYE